jgi:DNA helicase-2/ATP-dependent DNA helicase PcrA
MTIPETVLDAEQSRAAGVEAGDRQLVIAGPGSGKTEVVAALLEVLVEQEGLSASDEILVVSFSRAAVAAVRRRTARAGRTRVTVRTLDALAARVLDDLDDPDAWPRLSFDKRVARATTLLRDDGSDELRMIQHLVVDEVQDVVGLRADFLLAVIGQLPADAGFTLLGDPMQAIYDFQLDQRSGSTTTNEQLLDAVRAMPRVVERRLEGQYRAQSNEAAKLLGLGSHLSSCADVRGRAAVVEDELLDLLELDDAEQLPDLVARWGGSTALLCRTNGEALVLAARLRRSGGEVSLQRSMQDGATTGAVAKVLAASASSRVPRAECEDRAHAIGLIDPSGFTRLLSELATGRGSDIDLAAVARRLASGAVPIDLMAAPSAPMIVSTVHRAKGLEFDNVVLSGAHRWFGSRDIEDEAVRAAFVALTRTRYRAVALPAPDTRRLRADPASGRWVRTGSQPWMTFGFEVQGTDTRWPAPVGEPAPAVQQHLDSSVRPGDEVSLSLDPSESTLDRPVYGVFHSGLLVGRTTEDFGLRLRRRIGPTAKRKGRPWPGLSGAVVDSVETVGGLPAPEDRYGGAGRWGLWLSIRLSGLLDVEWGE